MKVGKGLVSALAVLGLAPRLALAEGSAIAPKYLFEASASQSPGKVANAHSSVVVTPDGGALNVTVNPSGEGYPGFDIVPAKGTVFDLSPWGNVNAKITNTGETQVGVAMRVDNAGDWRDSPWSTESVWLKPGESKNLKVIFGYQYGFKPGYALKSDAVIKVMFFANGKSDKVRAFRIEDLQAGGAAGEKPPVDPKSFVERPEGGVIVGPGAKLSQPVKLDVKDGATAQVGAKKTVEVLVAAGKAGSVALRPGAGTWDLGLSHEVKVVIRNTGKTPFLPTVRVEGNGGPTDVAAAEKPVAPGKTAEITVSFIPAKPWVGVAKINGAYNGGENGTGTKFESYRTKGVAVSVDAAPAERAFEIVSVTGAATPAVVPEWVGKRPPVSGDWKLTLEDNFDGNSLNLKLWNIYTPNYWDKRTHFSKDNAIVKDGKLILRYSKSHGFHSDNLYPEQDKGSSVYETDYACGYADTYGKWTQRYGYFEARMKLPGAPGLWPAFWMMPDRGGDPDPKANPQWKRASTGQDKGKDGAYTGTQGMEIDIMEFLSGWGPYRFNTALHWDGYGKEHKAVGTSNAYVPADKDGFITIGVLWTPGSFVFYGNGKEFGRWEHERACNVQSYPIFYMVSGGWANTPFDEKQLPSDFVVDYVRVWQRADLATPGDGPKPNKGEPRSQF